MRTLITGHTGPLACDFKLAEAYSVRSTRGATRVGGAHRGEGFTSVDYHQAVPVVVTELERITADPAGAAGAMSGRR
ncbi:hypothetical protein ACWGOK_33390 [Streptomyces eurythermus]|uniref:hypothetical protein n=1 Tax=Streptomyces eurythermus TaxID=42237 RepID=UPI0033D64E15